MSALWREIIEQQAKISLLESTIEQKDLYIDNLCRKQNKLTAELAAVKEELAETKRRHEEWKQVQFVMAAVEAAQGEGG